MQVLQAAKDLGGLDVVATICDMGTTNVKALKSMGSSTECPYFEGKDIFTLFDPPHLLKYIAALFRKHNVILSVNVKNEDIMLEAKFSDIRKAYDIDKETPLIWRPS